MSHPIQQAIESAPGALIPFLTAGYPRRDGTGRLLQAVDRAGASVIELGIPFSDSLADGPVVQSSYHQAIEAGMTLARALDQLAEVHPDLSAPVLLMGSYNPLLQMGIDRFLRRAARSGVSGILVPDLPPEDAGEFRQAALALGLAPIPLAAPNSRAERYQVMTQGAAGFLYQITRTGTTGAKTGKLPAYLGKQVRLAREISGLPVCLGFGISTPEQVREAWSMAEGAVVGSALLQALASEKSAAAQARRAGEFVSWLAQAREEV